MTTGDLIPLISAPSTWPRALTAATAMVLLAALDLLGALAAKEWALHRASSTLALGVAAFVALFWVYASALQYAELSVVTLGWIVILQVGLVALEQLRYGVHLPAGKLVAMTVVLVATAYLLVPTAASEAAG